MKAQIAIIAITAFLQASAVPFLSNNRPSLLGSFQENVNNVISQGQEIINQGKEQIEDAIDKGKEVISEHVEEVIDNLEDLNQDQIANLIEEFPLSIDDEFLISPNDIIEEAKETIAGFQDGISSITPEQVPTIIQENFPEISLNPEDVAFIVEGLENLQQTAVEVINENIALHSQICSQIRNAIKKTATAFMEQITKLVNAFQARLVNLIEKGEVFPSRALDVIEKSANDAINGFEKILNGLGVPEGIVESAIPVMRDATEKNIEIARTYISYLGGSKLGEIIEEIKTAIGNGLPTDVAIRNVFTTEIEAVHERFHNLRVGNSKQITSRGFFGELVQGFNQGLNQLLENERLQEELYILRQNYENKLREIQARIYPTMVQVEELGGQLQDGFFQYEVPQIIENAMANIRENFEIALQNVENFDDLQIAIGSSIQDMEAEVGGVIYGIMQQVLERIKYNIGNVMGALEEISLYAQENEWESEWPQNGGYENPALYRPVEEYPDQAWGAGFSGGAGASNNPDWSDPDRIFLTLI